MSAIEEPQYQIRPLKSCDLPEVYSILKNANYGHVLPGFRLVMKHKLVQYVLIFVSTITYAITRSIHVFVMSAFVFVSLCLLVTFLGAMLYIYGGTLEDLNEADELYIKASDNCFFVALKDGHVIGTIAIVKKSGCHTKTAWLRRMAVDKRYRKLGVAKALCENVFKFCKEREYSCIELITTDLHLPARRLYMKLGFECIDYKPYTYLKNMIHIWTYEFRYYL